MSLKKVCVQLNFMSLFGRLFLNLFVLFIDSITIYGQIDMQNTQNKPISIGKDPPNIGMTFEWTHLGSLNTFIYLVF